MEPGQYDHLMHQNLLRSFHMLINIRTPTTGDIKDEISELRQK
jgi:hypothetical protein